MSIHQFTFTTLRVCCLKTWVDFHIGLWQQQMYRLIVNGKSFSSSRWCFQNGSTQSPRDRLWNVQRSYLFNQWIAFLSLIAIFVFQSPHLRPPEIIIKTFLYHLSLFKDSSTIFFKMPSFFTHWKFHLSAYMQRRSLLSTLHARLHPNGYRADLDVLDINLID